MDSKVIKQEADIEESLIYIFPEYPREAHMLGVSIRSMILLGNMMKEKIGTTMPNEDILWCQDVIKLMTETFSRMKVDGKLFRNIDE